MLRESVAQLWALLAEADTNPNLLRPPTNMAKHRKNLMGRKPMKPRRVGRLKIARPRTKRKHRKTVKQNAVLKVQQARRNRDVAGMRYWNLKFAKHSTQ